MNTTEFSADVVSSLLDRIALRDVTAQEELFGLLVHEMEVRSGAKRYFPLAALRERSRQLLKQAMPSGAGLLVFYRTFADAALSVMAACSNPDASRAGRTLQLSAADFDRRSPGSGLFLRLYYVAGLNWDEISRLPATVQMIGDATDAMAHVVEALAARGCSEKMLQAQNLWPRGNVTRLLEEVRDGQRPLGDVVANEQAKLQLQAARLLRLERGISLQPADLVNEMFLRMPRDPQKAPVNRMEFEALAKRIMRHVLIDRARKPVPGQSRYSKPLTGDLPSNAPDIEERLQIERVMAVVEEVLQDLQRTEPESAEMLRATLMRGADQKELARLHSVSVSTVKRRLQSARQKIRKRLGLQ